MVEIWNLRFKSSKLCSKLFSRKNDQFQNEKRKDLKRWKMFQWARDRDQSLKINFLFRSTMNLTKQKLSTCKKIFVTFFNFFHKIINFRYFDWLQNARKFQSCEKNKGKNQFVVRKKSKIPLLNCLVLANVQGLKIEVENRSCSKFFYPHIFLNLNCFTTQHDTHLQHLFFSFLFHLHFANDFYIISWIEMKWD